MRSRRARIRVGFMVVALGSLGLSAGLIGGGSTAFAGGNECLVNGQFVPVTHNGTEIEGTNGDDQIYCFAAYSVLLKGGNGNDTLQSAGGSDTLLGGPGNDTLRGSYADDTLKGGSGDDSMDGGSGGEVNGDTCYGQGGLDTATNCETTNLGPGQ